MLKNTNWKYFFLFLILCDVVYTYIQNENTMMLDGDLSAIVLPADSYKQVLEDPFGMGVVLHNEEYAATNRFFIHYSMQKYFLTVPFILQKFYDPVESLFISNFIARTLIQVLIIYLLSVMISGSWRMINTNFIVAALLITPLFQVNGYNGTMGISLNSVTYTFFYSLPYIFILLYFIPFVRYFIHNRNLFSGCFSNLLLIVLALTIAFGGPLSPAIGLLLICVTGTFAIIYSYSRSASRGFIKRTASLFNSIPRKVILHFTFLGLICVYSMYIGSHNSENLWTVKPLSERYELLLTGLWKIFAKKLGLPLLVLICIINGILVWKFRNVIAVRYRIFLLVLIVFSLVYIISLPMGGYRDYRPYILRSDTISPVIISLMLFYGLTTILLLGHLRDSFKKIMITVCVAILLIYTNADRYDKDVNNCQWEDLYKIADSPDETVEIYGWCNLLSWERINDPVMSESNAEMLKIWNITDKKKLFYHAPD